MNTLSRLNLLFLAVHMPPVHSRDLWLTHKVAMQDDRNIILGYISGTPVHDLIDRIDRQVGIITRRKHGGGVALVGERLRRLERHIKARELPPYFWLGADAVDLALTG